ncbi:MAG: HAMP domain-containing sensor histidine kinase, partial [Desulfofustis sp.]|nr:HAMP domain-containing sensor histidine kinase [Desulfofustis sp.]
VKAGKTGEGTIVIRFVDSGVGFAPHDLDRVFDLFFSTKTDGEGTGLGLWMCYELVKKYQGDISLISQKGKGTSVILTIAEES